MNFFLNEFVALKHSEILSTLNTDNICSLAVILLTWTTTKNKTLQENISTYIFGLGEWSIYSTTARKVAISSKRVGWFIMFCMIIKTITKAQMKSQ